MATARSNPMTVPRNPDTIRGPCSRVSCAMDGGTFQPRRARPASTPAASEANPRIRSGSLNGTPRSLERMRGGPSGAARRYAANANPPHIRTAFQVFPAELAAVFGLELVIERLGVVVIDQEQGFARSQFGEGAENQWMALTRNNGADIDGVLGGCGHDRSPDVGEGGFNSNQNVRVRARSSCPGSMVDPIPVRDRFRRWRVPALPVLAGRHRESSPPSGRPVWSWSDRHAAGLPKFLCRIPGQDQRCSSRLRGR